MSKTTCSVCGNSSALYVKCFIAAYFLGNATAIAAAGKKRKFDMPVINPPTQPSKAKSMNLLVTKYSDCVDLYKKRPFSCVFTPSKPE